MRKPRALVVLEDRRAELETCSYCPKLCRAACPVSDAEASDTVTPWGKMRGMHAVGRGAAPASAEYAELAWACTGCFACRERCDHRNPVRETLYAARAEFVQRGVAPESSERVRRGFQARSASVRSRISELAHRSGLSRGASTALLLGCDYVLRLPKEVDAAIQAVQSLFGPIRLLSECCGSSLDAAGDPEGARVARVRVQLEAAGARRVIALDSGCAFALRDLGFETFPRAALTALGPRSGRPPYGDEALRYHDSCLLGRGLGEYEAPRELVARASARGALEFAYRREHARCSGGGGLLPVTRPETSASITRTRILEHERLGSGTIVTACAQSLRRFRAQGARAVDLATVVWRLVGGQATALPK